MNALMIATVAAGIEAEFGPDAYAALSDRVEQLVDRLAAQSIAGHVAALDDPVRMAAAGLPALGSGPSTGTVAAVRAYAQRQGCDAVLLLGGHRVLPMVEVVNPVRNRALDADTVVLTDLPYGADGENLWDYATCPRIVSRIPSPRSGRLEDFLALIDGVAAPSPAKSGSTAIVSEEWRAEGTNVAHRMPGPVLVRYAPHYELDERHRDDLTRRWLYVNLHGRRDHDQWQAFGGSRTGYVTVMDHASFGFPEVAGSSLYCENCYGFKPLSDPPGETCIDAGFRSGLRSVVAATGLAYGAHLTKDQYGGRPFLENADFLASAFFDGVKGSLGAGEAFHEARRRFLERIRRIVDGSTAMMKTTARDARELGREYGVRTAVMILSDARNRLQRHIDLSSSWDGHSEDTPDLRGAVQRAVARVTDVRSAIRHELSRLNREAAGVFDEINRILSYSRGPEIELPLGVYETNAVVAYRVFEQSPPERYALVPAAAGPGSTPETFGVTLEGMVRADETGAMLADAAGEGFRFVGGSMFEVHRTYRLAAFGAFAWSLLDKRPIYKVRKTGDKVGVAERVGTSGGQMSYVVGAKVHPGDPSLFPGSSRGWRRTGILFGVPVNSVPGVLLGVSWGPYGGMELMGGVHWAKYPERDENIDLGETELRADANDEFPVPVHDRHQLRPFIGVSLDSNIFTSLFGAVANIGGAF